MSFRSKRKKKDFIQQKQRIYCQQTWHKRNVEEKFFRQKDYDESGNLEQHKEMKNTGKGINEG